jgi:hypothetical protein
VLLRTLEIQQLHFGTMPTWGCFDVTRVNMELNTPPTGLCNGRPFISGTPLKGVGYYLIGTEGNWASCFEIRIDTCRKSGYIGV